MEFKTAEQIADILNGIYAKPFGGKSKGRFQISRTMLARISGRTFIKDVTIDDVAEIMATEDYGFILINLGDAVCVISEPLLRSYRKVPKTVIMGYKPKLLVRKNDDEEQD